MLTLLAPLVLLAVTFPTTDATLYLRGNISVALWADGPTADWIDFAFCPEGQTTPCSGGIACVDGQCLSQWQNQPEHLSLGHATGLLLATVANGFQRPLTVVGVSIVESSDAAAPGRPIPKTPPRVHIEHGRLEVRRGGTDASIPYRARLEGDELIASLG